MDVTGSLQMCVHVRVCAHVCISIHVIIMYVGVIPSLYSTVQ